jgi:hypothetical protein
VHSAFETAALANTATKRLDRSTSQDVKNEVFLRLTEDGLEAKKLPVPVRKKVNLAGVEGKRPIGGNRRGVYLATKQLDNPTKPFSRLGEAS